MHIQNVFFAMDIIKVFNRVQYEKLKFKRLIKIFIFNSTSERALIELNRPLSEMFGSFALIAIFTFGTFKIWQGEMKFDQMMEFVVILFFIAPYIQRLTRLIFIKQKMDVYGKRIEETLKIPQEIEREDLGRLRDFSGRLTVKNLGFSYPQQETPAIKNIHLEVEAGSFIAIVGASGSGKSTFVNLIPKLLIPSQGSIYFDGQDYRQISLKSIREQIAYVSQESILFPGTIRDNIRYGNLNASDKEIIEAAKHAYIHDFIMQREGQYDALIGERGMKLSGGQRQRICIARAILKKPKILILDEATSALDTHSERAVQQAIESLLHQQTTFVIAHRLSTILNADKIIVFEEGTLIEQGTHQKLLESGGVYAKLYQIQFQS